MLDAIIRQSLRQRWVVLGAALLLLIIGGLLADRMPVDIFPDLTAPTVTVIAEARGMGPEEVELLVTFPLESALNGAPSVRRLRSFSAAGIVVIRVDFQWGTDIYLARQVVTERLQTVALPAGVGRPELGPIGSVMGQIAFVALASDTVDSMELRRLADTLVRRGLLSVPGISQVVVIGGDRRQYLVEADPAALSQTRISVDDLVLALKAASGVAAAGFHVDRGQEYLVRGLGRARSAEDLANVVLRFENGRPLLVGHVAEVRVVPEPKRGTAAFRGENAVVLSLQKQPEANTLELTARMDATLAEIQRALPEGVRIETDTFRQADFIDVAIANVSTAMRDGAILVLVVLLLFLGDVSATVISAVAIPLSLMTGVLVLSAFGGTINTMTLGGFTIAIGALVDDAIIDVENVLRRLREEHARPPADRRADAEVVFRASSEVRRAILFATLVIALVFLPLLVLPGMEGRLLRPLGLAYVASLAGSLVVALTVTPVLCLVLLPRGRVLERREPRLLRLLKRVYDRVIVFCLARPAAVLVTAGLGFVLALGIWPFLGRSFLPPFNEGSLNLALISPPGTPLEEGDALGTQVERALLEFPEVVSTMRRTGRAERDEHIQGVNASEIEVVLRTGRPKAELLAEMRRAVSTIPGVVVTFGQPISHRIDHMISGSRTNLAVKIYGPDLAVLRSLSGRAEQILEQVTGVVDLSNEEQASVPQLLVDFDRPAMARYGLTPASLARSVEALFQGTDAGQILESGLVSRVAVAFPEKTREHRELLEALPITTPDGDLVRLGEVAVARFDLGPSLVRREDVQRLAVLTANIEGADILGVVEQADVALRSGLDLPAGYRLALGGQFEEGARSLRNLTLIGGFILVGMYGLLFVAFRSHRHSVIVLVNLPLALIGGVFAIAASGGVVSVASMVGFITLFGVATRNGVLLVTHYQHLMRDEGLGLSEAVVRGSRERLAPVLLTALTAGLALVPLVLAGDHPGNEIQSPMAEVILGGLLSSTLLNLVVVPVLFQRFGDGERQRP